ncbi:MAG: tetratricopeptide repeat protein [Candidatus Moraniibacteriota bacterium]
MTDKQNDAKQSEYQAGLENFSKGNFKEAIDLMEKNNQGANDPNALFKLAVSYYNQKEYDKSIEYYKKVLELDSSNSLAYNGLANVYRDQNNKDKAVENYKKSIEINPTFALAYSNLAIMLMDLGENKEAGDIIEDGLKNVPNSPELKNVEIFFKK